MDDSEDEHAVVYCFVQNNMVGVHMTPDADAYAGSFRPHSRLVCEESKNPFQICNVFLSLPDAKLFDPVDEYFSQIIVSSIREANITHDTCHAPW